MTNEENRARRLARLRAGYRRWYSAMYGSPEPSGPLKLGITPAEVAEDQARGEPLSTPRGSKKDKDRR